MSEVWVKIRDVVRHGLLVQTWLDLLRRAGVEIKPYYLVEESLDEMPANLPEPRAPHLQMRFLSPEDAAAVGRMPEGDLSERAARDPMETGVCGFGAWSDGELVAFNWANLRELYFEPCRRPPAEDEAYLFGAKTARPYRGMNLGPAMRRELYVQLAALGRRRLLSISYTFNRPAIRFKQKLNARFTHHYLYLGLWGWYRRNFLLKRDPHVR